MTYGLDLGIIGLLVESKMPTKAGKRQPIIRYCIYVHVC